MIKLVLHTVEDRLKVAVRIAKEISHTCVSKFLLSTNFLSSYCSKKKKRNYRDRKTEIKKWQTNVSAKKI